MAADTYSCPWGYGVVSYAEMYTAKSHYMQQEHTDGERTQCWRRLRIPVNARGQPLRAVTDKPVNKYSFTIRHKRAIPWADTDSQAQFEKQYASVVSCILEPDQAVFPGSFPFNIDIYISPSSTVCSATREGSQLFRVPNLPKDHPAKGWDFRLTIVQQSHIRAPDGSFCWGPDTSVRVITVEAVEPVNRLVLDSETYDSLHFRQDDIEEDDDDDDDKNDVGITKDDDMDEAGGDDLKTLGLDPWALAITVNIQTLYTDGCCCGDKYGCCQFCRGNAPAYMRCQPMEDVDSCPLFETTVADTLLQRESYLTEQGAKIISDYLDMADIDPTLDPPAYPKPMTISTLRFRIRRLDELSGDFELVEPLEHSLMDLQALENRMGHAYTPEAIAASVNAHMTVTEQLSAAERQFLADPRPDFGIEAEVLEDLREQFYSNLGNSPDALPLSMRAQWSEIHGIIGVVHEIVTSRNRRAVHFESQHESIIDARRRCEALLQTLNESLQSLRSDYVAYQQAIRPEARSEPTHGGDYCDIFALRELLARNCGDFRVPAIMAADLESVMTPAIDRLETLQRNLRRSRLQYVQHPRQLEDSNLLRQLYNETRDSLEQVQAWLYSGNVDDMNGNDDPRNASGSVIPSMEATHDGNSGTDRVTAPVLTGDGISVSAAPAENLDELDGIRSAFRHTQYLQRRAVHQATRGINDLAIATILDLPQQPTSIATQIIDDRGSGPFVSTDEITRPWWDSDRDMSQSPGLHTSIATQTVEDRGVRHSVNTDEITVPAWGGHLSDAMLRARYEEDTGQSADGLVFIRTPARTSSEEGDMLSVPPAPLAFNSPPPSRPTALANSTSEANGASDHDVEMSEDPDGSGPLSVHVQSPVAEDEMRRIATDFSQSDEDTMWPDIPRYEDGPLWQSASR